MHAIKLLWRERKWKEIAKLGNLSQWCEGVELCYISIIYWSDLGEINDLKSASGEFDSNGGLGFEAKLVASESGQEIGFSNTRITDQYNLEQIIVLFLCSPSHPPFSFLLITKKPNPTRHRLCFWMCCSTQHNTTTELNNKDKTEKIIERKKK